MNNTSEISVTRLRLLSREMLANVALGKTFVITKYGKPIAQISKPKEHKDDKVYKP